MSNVDSTTYENAYTSAVERFCFATEAWPQIFCYPSTGSEHAFQAQTWMGEPLSRPHSARFGRRWRDNFGGERQSISFVGINGYWYHGTRYMGSGDYIRAKRGKLAN